MTNEVLPKILQASASLNCRPINKKRKAVPKKIYAKNTKKKMRRNYDNELLVVMSSKRLCQIY